MFGLKEESVVDIDAELSNAPVKHSIQQQSYSWLTYIDTALRQWWQTIARRLSGPQAAWEHSPEPSTVMAPAQSTNLSCEASRDDILEAQSVRSALRVVGLHLTKQGFALGKDFSMGQEKLILNERAYAYLQQSMEPDHFADIVELDVGLLIQDQT